MRVSLLSAAFLLIALQAACGSTADVPSPVAPVIGSFTATPGSVVEGRPTEVTWSWSFANSPTPAPSCAIDQGVDAVTSGQSTSVSLAAATTFTLTCTNEAGSDTASTTVAVTPAPVAPVIGSFTATPSAVIQGVSTNLTWSWTFANSPTPAPACSIDQGITATTSGATASVTQMEAVTYTLTCANAAGADTASTTVAAQPPPAIAPQLASFTASPSTVAPSTSTPITWSWSFANSPTPSPVCTIDHGVDAVANGQTTSVSLAATTTFSLTCGNEAGSDQLTAEIAVEEPAGPLTCPPIVNGDSLDCPSYLGSNVVSLSVGGTLDQASLSCNPGAHLDRTYCWSAPTAGTYRFDITSNPSSLGLGLFSHAPDCGELACSATASAQVLDLAMTAGQKVYVVLEEGPSGNHSFTLGISRL